MQPKLLDIEQEVENGRQILFCNANTVKFEKRDDGLPLNIRGKIRNTTDLETSVKAAGNKILHAVHLRIGEAGHLICVEGHRRTVVARKLKIPLPYILVETDESLDIVAHMLASNVRKAFPNLVIDQNGEIIGGLAYAVCQKLQQGKTPMQVAQLMGYKTDKTVKRLLALYQADFQVKKAVATGRMSLSAFDAIRFESTSQQTAVLEAIEDNNDDDEVTFTKEKLRRASTKLKLENQKTLVTIDEPTTVEQLNTIKNKLAGLLKTEARFGPREKLILEKIKGMIDV